MDGLSMIFDEFIGITDISDCTLSRLRTAVRAVILEKNCIWMMRSKRGDYKFPGGGVKKGETMHDALRRELAEETGFVLTDDIRMLGRIIEQRPDSVVPYAYFRMESLYFQCTLTGERRVSNLTQKEQDWKLESVLIPIEDAIMANNAEKENTQAYSWVERETLALTKVDEWLKSQQKC
ncbi:MAG: NUDIX domain-containing protein [Clostridiales bacterium]|jgi:8-oxo-dGTP pyrophosphatase MutT (NUDIX family)|nr:NUDIX domain-containing protein [Clostridiales bacterium]